MSMASDNMSTERLETWSRTRWWITLIVIMAAQVGLVFWFGDRKVATPRASAPSPALGLLGSQSSSVLEFNDPTIFAMPHSRGFSGPAWLDFPGPKFRPVDWSEPPRWLPFSLADLGAVFQTFAATNTTKWPSVPGQPPPDLTQPTLTSVPLATEVSRIRIEGDLDEKQLLAPLQLRPQEWPDLLTNSVVQALINASGRTVSATLLQRSGSAEADRFALEQAKTARFQPVAAGEPVNSPAGPLRWARFIFQWHTVAPVAQGATNPSAPVSGLPTRQESAITASVKR